MDNAKKAALETYPVRKDGRKRYYSCTDDDVRKLYAQGYRKSEKDLALTIKDLELLHTFLFAVKNNKQGCFTFTRLSDEQYQEVLRRFNEQRRK